MYSHDYARSPIPKHSGLHNSAIPLRLCKPSLIKLRAPVGKLFFTFDEIADLAEQLWQKVTSLNNDNRSTLLYDKEPCYLILSYHFQHPSK